MLALARTVIFGFCLFSINALSSSSHIDSGARNMGEVKTLQVKFNPKFEKVSGLWVQKVSLPPSIISYVLLVKAKDNISKDLTVSITDGAGQVSSYNDLLNLKGMRQGQTKLSPVLRIEAGYSVAIQIGGLSSGGKPPIELELLLLDQLDSAPLTGISDGQPLIQNEEYTSLGKSVARLIFSKGACTGFAITPDLMLTNNHCVISTKKLCEELAIEFNAVEKSVAGNVARCVGLVSSDPLLDYALIRFVPKSPVTPLALFFAEIPKTEAKYFSIHHPWGQDALLSFTKQILGTARPDIPNLALVTSARKACGLEVSAFATTPLEQFRTTLNHRIDTDPGSSGAPIIYDRKVVALHFDMDRRLYLRGWSRPESAKFDCLKARAGYVNWATDLCPILRHAAKNEEVASELKQLAESCKR